MKRLRLRAGDLIYEADGPPRVMVADVTGGTVVLVFAEPGEGEQDLRLEARKIREERSGVLRDGGE